MSKFEGLGGIPVRKNKFEGLGGVPVQRNNMSQSQQEDEGYLATIGKSAITGASRILDLPQVAGVLAEKGSRGFAKKLGETAQGNTSLGKNIKSKLQEYGNNREVISQIKPASQRVRDFVGGEGNLDARPSTPGQRIAADIADFGTSFATNPLGFIGTAGKIGQTSFNLAKTGATVGGVAGSLKEIGVDPLKADIGASLAIPFGGIALKKSIGLSPNKINKEVYEAANELGIKLPAATVSRSKALDWAENFISRVPGAGDILHNKYHRVGTRITEELEKIYDKIIPKTELAVVQDKISKLYEKAETTLPQNAIIEPTNLINKINQIEKKIGDSYYTSTDQKTVLNDINEIKNKIQKDINTQGVQVHKLIQAKKGLNDNITWDKSNGYKDFLKGVQRAINEDIKVYSKTSKDAENWYNFYTDADKLFGKLKTKEELEHILTVKTTDYTTETVKHANLSKIIHDPKSRQRIEQLVNKLGENGKETLDKIKKIGTVAKALTIKNKNIPNPSGTGPFTAVLSIAGGLFYQPIKTIIGTGAIGLTTALITNQKFLDSAYKSLVLKDKSALIRFESQIKTITGSSIVDLSKEIDRKQNRPILTKEERKKKDELRKEESKKAAEKFKNSMDNTVDEIRKESLFDFSTPLKQNKTK